MAKQEQVAKAVYDETLDSWRIITPFNKAWIEELKYNIPASARSWDASNKAWLVVDEFLDVIDMLCQKHFKINLKKVKPESTVAPQQLQHAPLKYQQFLALLPSEAIKTAFRTGMLIHHPDKGGDSQKAQELMAIYAELKTEFNIK